MNPELLCMRFMSSLHEPNGVCPVCGFDNAAAENAPNQLDCGSILAGTYLVGCVLGQGGFGITYIGFDLNLNLKVAIKEYYPEGCVTRDGRTHTSVVPLPGEKIGFRALELLHGRLSRQRAIPPFTAVQPPPVVA